MVIETGLLVLPVSSSLTNSKKTRLLNQLKIKVNQISDIHAIYFHYIHTTPLYSSSIHTSIEKQNNFKSTLSQLLTYGSKEENIFPIEITNAVNKIAQENNYGDNIMSNGEQFQGINGKKESFITSYFCLSFLLLFLLFVFFFKL